MPSPQRTPSTVEVIALIFASLGWITFGLLAIPGVIIAHTVRGTETMSVALRCAFRVGYTSIILSGMLMFVQGYLYLTELAQLRAQVGMDLFNRPKDFPLVERFELPSFVQEPAFWVTVVLTLMIGKWVILPLSRKMSDWIQSARILRVNRTR